MRSGKNRVALNSNNKESEELSINYTDRSNISTQRSDNNKNGPLKHKTKGRGEQHSEVSLTSHGLSILPSKPLSSSTSSTHKNSLHNINNNNIDTNNNEIDSSSDSKKVEFQPRPPPKKDLNKKKTVPRRRIVKSADIRSRVPSSPREDVDGGNVKRPQRQKQVFSKSADSRNRRRPSLLSENSEDQLPAITQINKSIITRKRISRSAFDLEKTEQTISENRDLHFKSKSLSVLPKIGGGTTTTLPTKRNDRYGKSVTSSQNTDNDNDKELSQDNFTDDNVFVTTTTEKDQGDNDNNNIEDPDVSSEELLALADENEVEDYLKLRTRSSCREDDTTSSCNSANSDLYMYSSRPRSVVRQRANSSRSRQPSETEKQQQRSSRTSSRNAITAADVNNNNTEEFLSDRNRSLSLKLSQQSSKQNPCKTSSEMEARERTSLTYETEEKERSIILKNNNNNDTFTVASSHNMLNESRDFNNINNNNNNNGGLDLSWEYSESTSMLILPEELKTKNKNNQNKQQNHNTLINVRYGTNNNDFEHNSLDKDEGFSGHHDNEEQTPLNSDLIGKNDSEVTVADTTSSGVVSDASSNEDMTRNDELSSLMLLNQQKKQNNSNHAMNSNLSPVVNRKQQPAAINSSYIMRESCDSDSMSWLQASNQDFDENNNNNLAVNQQHTPPIFNDKLNKSPSMALKQRLKEQLGSLLIQSTTGGDDNEDGMSECSDDTTFTDMPPKKFKNYRYNSFFYIFLSKI